MYLQYLARKHPRCTGVCASDNLLLFKQFVIINFMDPFRGLQCCKVTPNNSKHPEGHLFLEVGGCHPCIFSFPGCYCHCPSWLHNNLQSSASFSLCVVWAVCFNKGVVVYNRKNSYYFIGIIYLNIKLWILL